MEKQIEQALDGLGGMGADKREKTKKILQSYAEGRITLQEAYYELLENELIPMPKRCGMFAGTPITPDVEENLKRRIKERIS